MFPQLRQFILLTVCLLLTALNGTAEGMPAKETDKANAALEAIVTETNERIRNRSLYFRGERIFTQMCIHCHGTTGRGNGPWAAEMINKPRNLRLGIFKFRTTSYGKLPTTDDLRRTIRSGVSGTAMPAFSKFTDAELDSIVAFVQSLSRRWRDGKQFAIPLDLPKAPPDWFDKKQARREHAAAAKPLFKNLCSACHGAGGKGDGPASKGLIDVWENPISPADLTQPHFKSGDQAKDIYRTIAAGLDGTPMIGYHGALKPKQIWGLVAHIREIKSADE